MKLNYSGDIDIAALHSQLSLLPVMFSKNIKTIACFDDFFEALKELPTEERQLISEVVTICKLIQ